MLSKNLKNTEDIYNLYVALGWNDYLQLSGKQIYEAMVNSFHSIYVYENDQLIGTGRIISDGIINAYICGIGVQENYRNRGIGTEILNNLMKVCKENKLHMQLFCEAHLEGFYEKKGLTKFAIGMKNL